MYRLIEELKEKQKATNDEVRGELVDISVFVLVSFLRTLRSEVMLKAVLGKTKEYYDKAGNNACMLYLKGK